MTRLVDFDAFRAEHTKDPVILRIGGKDYELPPSLPAAVAVDMIRLRATMLDTDDVPMNILDSMGKAVFGDTVWMEVLEQHRVTTDEVADLLQMVLSVYSTGDQDPPTASTRRTRKSSSRS